ncbi:hypothetical protein VTK26DRAFT_5494 [Humicola hyalothermophila]
MADSETPEPTLDIERHLKYWKMCLQAPLPVHYLSNDGNRMALAYFIINAISLLTPHSSQAQRETGRKPLIPPEDRPKLRQWVLSHQQPGGGFAPTPSVVFPPKGDGQWEAVTGDDDVEGAGIANLPGTLFALQLLALLADENNEACAFDGVDRVQTLKWLRRLQREDGSFGEVLKRLPGHGWFIGGGYDMRYCYIAASIRWILRGDVKEGEPGWVEDFDTKGLAEYILRTQTYDGGFAGSSQEEPHAGYAFCAISALSLLDRPQETTDTPHHSKILHQGIRNMPGLIHWLASRQFVYLDPSSPLAKPPCTSTTNAAQDPGDPNSPQEDDDDDEEDEDNFLLPHHPSALWPPQNRRHVACNGRCNKVADTCYTWWVGAALVQLGLGLPANNSNSNNNNNNNPQSASSVLDWPASRRFLLEKTAHRVGGFAKYPGGPPDVYHACFGLTALAVMGEEPGLNRVDAGLAVPVHTVKVMEKARARLLEKAKGGGGADW